MSIRSVGYNMCATFTDDEIGKPVERADGKVIGTVASIDGETAHVEPAPDVVDTVKARLGWEEIGDPFELDARFVRTISDTRVHLEREFSERNAHGDAGNDSDSVSSANRNR